MTAAPTSTWGPRYDAGLDALADLLERHGTGPDVVERTVAATPDWTVRQVVAHLAGTAADVTARRMDGAPGRAWTDRHVGERSATTTTALLAELRRTQPAMAAGADDAVAAVFNLLVHHADLAETLGERQDPSLWRPVLAQLRPRWSRLGLVPPDADPAEADPAAADLPEADPTAADPTAENGPVEVDGYLLYRALFTRLSRAEARAAGIDDAAADALGLFGPPSS